LDCSLVLICPKTIPASLPKADTKCIDDCPPSWLPRSDLPSIATTLPATSGLSHARIHSTNRRWNCVVSMARKNAAKCHRSECRVYTAGTGVKNPVWTCQTSLCRLNFLPHKSLRTKLIAVFPASDAAFSDQCGDRQAVQIHLKNLFSPIVVTPYSDSIFLMR